jgi:hypothetical protein
MSNNINPQQSTAGTSRRSHGGGNPWHDHTTGRFTFAPDGNGNAARQTNTPDDTQKPQIIVTAPPDRLKANTRPKDALIAAQNSALPDKRFAARNVQYLLQFGHGKNCPRLYQRYAIQPRRSR